MTEKVQFPMKRSISKKAKKVIEKGIEDLTTHVSLGRITRIGAQMMLQVAIEEKVTAYLGRDYYERNDSAYGSSKRVKAENNKGWQW